MKIKDLLRNELPRLLKSTISRSAGMLFTEMFGQSCYMIKFHPETVEHQKQILRINLRRNALNTADLRNIERIIKFTVKHPEEAVVLSPCSEYWKEKMGKNTQLLPI